MIKQIIRKFKIYSIINETEQHPLFKKIESLFEGYYSSDKTLKEYHRLNDDEQIIATHLSNVDVVIISFDNVYKPLNEIYPIDLQIALDLYKWYIRNYLTDYKPFDEITDTTRITIGN